MRILVVDDHALFRDALSLVLRDLAEDLKLIHAATAAEALAVTQHYRGLDLILLDLDLPGTDGLSALDGLKQADPTVPVVVVSASDHAEDVRAALDAGVSGYIPKTVPSHELLTALRQILDGDVFVPPALLAQMQGLEASDREYPADAEQLPLTTRQREILRLMAEGLPNKSIANRLDLTEETVKLHVSAVLRALGSRNRTEAVMLAERKGLLGDR